jgi:alpha-tubulin suppressor-like RCC1 family protein
VAKSSPVTIVGGITNWSQLSAGFSHSLGITSTGIAYAWGYNTYGRLGDNTTSTRSSPVTVVGGITTWSLASAGFFHSIGLTSTGIAYAWGYGSNGLLGDNTDVSKSSPVTVVGGITTWSQASVGGGHSLAVTSTGIAYAWGLNTGGRLGDGTIVVRSSPVTVVGGITTWSQVSTNAAGVHSLGLTSTGIAYAWGTNTNGRLGDNTTTARSRPVTIVGGITTWSQVSAGSSHSSGIIYTTTKGFA